MFYTAWACHLSRRDGQRHQRKPVLSLPLRAWPPCCSLTAPRSIAFACVPPLPANECAVMPIKSLMNKWICTSILDAVDQRDCGVIKVLFAPAEEYPKT